MRAPTTPTICAIAALVVLEVVALLTGHNGTILRLVIVAIAGLGGFSLAKVLETKHHTNTPDHAPDFLNK